MFVRPFCPSRRGLREKSAADFLVKVLHEMLEVPAARWGKDIGVHEERATNARGDNNSDGKDVEE